MGMYAPFKTFLEQLKSTKPDVKIHYVVSCLNDSPPPKGEGQFITSQDPDTIQYGDSTKIRDEVEALTKNTSDMPVILIGHSYGGWASMYLTETIRPSIRISALFTLDAISTECGPFQVVMGSAPCKQAPKDLNNKLIIKRVNHWENFYQNQDSWLHSSEIPEALNHLMTYRGPHTQIDSDPNVWNLIRIGVLNLKQFD